VEENVMNWTKVRGKVSGDQAIEDEPEKSLMN
jgi:hypothetical protein